MAYQIAPELCDGCGACEPECPNRAISHVEKIYKITPAKCKECAGRYGEPTCVRLCNTNACVVIL